MIASNNNLKNVTFLSFCIEPRQLNLFLKKIEIRLLLCFLGTLTVIQTANAKVEQKRQCATSPRAAYAMLTNQHQQTQSRKANQVININTASVAELIQLPNIGVRKAQAIVNYRLQHGTFRSVLDLTKVKGIGQKTLNKFQHRLTIQ